MPELVLLKSWMGASFTTIVAINDSPSALGLSLMARLIRKGIHYPNIPE